jgi:hypothetical protein
VQALERAAPRDFNRNLQRNALTSLALMQVGAELTVANLLQCLSSLAGFLMLHRKAADAIFTCASAACQSFPPHWSPIQSPVKAIAIDAGA